MFGTRCFRVVFGLLLVAYAVPLFAFRHLPIQDLPSHLAIVATLNAEHLDPTWSRHFISHLQVGPYFGFYGLCIALSRWFSLDLASRLVLGLFVLGLPLSYLFLIRSVNPAARWSSLFAFLFIFAEHYLVGFVNYLLSLPCLLFGLGAAFRLRQRPGVLPAVCLAASALGACLTHPFSLAALVGLVTLMLLINLRPRAVPSRIYGYALAALAPAVALFVRWWSTVALPRTSLAWAPFSFKARFLLLNPLVTIEASLSPSGGEKRLFVIPVLLFIGLCALLLRRRRPDEPLLQSTATPLLLATAAAYCALPFVIAEMYWCDLRLAVVVWLLLFMTIAARPITSRPFVLGLVLLCGINLASALRIHAVVSRETEPLARLIEQLPPRQRIYALALDPDTTADAFYAAPLQASYFRHAASAYILRKGGEGPHMVFQPSLPWIPLELKNPAYRDPRFDVRTALTRWPPDLNEVAEYFDLILVRTRSAEARRKLAELGTLAAAEGLFAAYRVVHRTVPSTSPTTPGGRR